MLIRVWWDLRRLPSACIKHKETMHRSHSRCAIGSKDSKGECCSYISYLFMSHTAATKIGTGAENKNVHRDLVKL